MNINVESIIRKFICTFVSRSAFLQEHMHLVATLCNIEAVEMHIFIIPICYLLLPPTCNIDNRRWIIHHVWLVAKACCHLTHYDVISYYHIDC